MLAYMLAVYIRCANWGGGFKVFLDAQASLAFKLSLSERVSKWLIRSSVCSVQSQQSLHRLYSLYCLYRLHSLHSFHSLHSPTVSAVSKVSTVSTICTDFTSFTGTSLGRLSSIFSVLFRWELSPSVSFSLTGANPLTSSDPGFVMTILVSVSISRWQWCK